ncbi:MAG: glycosyltransferase family protein [Solirubrobacteraceae bacterium]
MQLVLSTSSLEGVGGSETYVITVADQLQRLGHDVWLHALDLGAAAESADRLGLRVCRSEEELTESPDALVVQDGVVSCLLAERFPSTPQLFVAHSDIFDLQLPPQLPGLVAVVVALYDRVEQRLRALALPSEIVRLTQPIDVERFKPSRALNQRPRVALALGNYVHGQRLAFLQAACERAGIELRHVGSHALGGKRSTEQELNEADIVFGKARVIYEAMSCGRAAYVFDHNGGDGWVTADTYPALSADNFGGQSGTAVITPERLIADLAEYRPEMGVVNRDLVVAHHSATKHAARLVGILAALAPRAQPVDAPLRELARLVRLYHRADIQAFVARAEIEALAVRADAAESALAAAQERAKAAEEALAEALRRAL